MFDFEVDDDNDHDQDDNDHNDDDQNDGDDKTFSHSFLVLPWVNFDCCIQAAG